MDNELNTLIARVRKTDLALPALADRAGVKVRWLRTFLAGDIPEPGYSKVRRLQRAVRSARRKAA